MAVAGHELCKSTRASDVIPFYTSPIPQEGPIRPKSGLSGPALGWGVVLLMTKNAASAYIHIEVPYYQKAYAFGVRGLYKLMQDFYHQQYRRRHLRVL